MDMGKFVDRRLHTVRVAMSLMNHELELGQGDNMVTIDQDILRSVIETISMFVEDFEASYRAVRETNQKKFVQAGAAKAG